MVDQLWWLYRLVVADHPDDLAHFSESHQCPPLGHTRVCDDVSDICYMKMPNASNVGCDVGGNS